MILPSPNLHFFKKTVSALLSLVFLLSSEAHGVSPARKKWQLQVGAMGSNLEQRFSVPSQFTNRVSQIQGLLGIQRRFELSKKTSFHPEIFTLIPWRSGYDGTTKTFTTHFGLKVDKEIFSSLHLNVGPGLLWESHLSTGNYIEVNNGLGTSTFYTPARWTQVFLFTVGGGLDWWLTSKLSFHLGVIVPDIADSNRRRFHGVLNLGILL